MSDSNPSSPVPNTSSPPSSTSATITPASPDRSCTPVLSNSSNIAAINSMDTSTVNSSDNNNSSAVGKDKNSNTVENTTSSSTTNSSNNSSSNNNNSNNNNTSSSATSSFANGQQQFCLRWNNYQSNLLQVFEQLLETESFVDVTLSCEEKSIKCHRMVLSACSPYFQAVLKDADCSHPVIILQGVKWIELKAVVEFMYKGQINVSQDNLSGLLKVAESLKVRGLTETGEGDDTEAVLTTPSPRAASITRHHQSRVPADFSLNEDDEAPRKRRRQSEEDSTSSYHQNNRSRSPSPNGTPPMVPVDFLDASMDPLMPPNSSMGRSSVSSHSSSTMGNGILPNAGSPTASLASSLSSLAAHLPGGLPPPAHPMGSLPPHLPHLPPISPLSPLLNMHHPMAAAAARHHHNPEDFEIRPGIAEMIREEERRRRDAPDMAKLLESPHHWIGTSMAGTSFVQQQMKLKEKADTYQAQVQAAWQKSWNQTQSLLQNLRFRERGPLKSWRPETMADAIHAVLKEGLSLSQAARKYDIPYPTFVLYANRVHNLLGPSSEPGDLRPKGRGRPQRILLGSWPEDQIKVVIRAVVFRDTSVFKEDHKARMEGKHSSSSKQIKEENSNGSHAANALTPLGLAGINSHFKSSPSTPSSTPDPNRLSAGTSQSIPTPNRGPTPQGLPLSHLSAINPLLAPSSSPGSTSHTNSNSLNRNSHGNSGESGPAVPSHRSPQQSPAVSTPLAPPLSSPATPDPAIPPPSPSIVSPSPLCASTTQASMNSAVTTTTSPQHSPSNASPPRRSSPSNHSSSSGNYHGSRTQGMANGPHINGANTNSSNGPMMTQPLGFPQHLLQQQMIGGLMQGALRPNIAPPPNHNRMPHLPPSPYANYMRPPVPPHNPSRPMMPEESPEALLFNKLVGGNQFPNMGRPFFQQDGSSQNSRNPNMMFHRESGLDNIKSEPEPILN